MVARFFLAQHAKNREKYQMITKFTKRKLNIPTFCIPNVLQKYIFWYENIPSGNRDFKVQCQNAERWNAEQRNAERQNAKFGIND
jgi:hypothetical protein